jgi:hypothetical protein
MDGRSQSALLAVGVAVIGLAVIGLVLGLSALVSS